MSVKDVIKKSVLESEGFNQAIDSGTIATILMNMAVAVLVGIVIYMVYKKFYNGVVYSRNYALTLIGMTVLTCMLTLAISTNIVISLGMVGALSIVRYRTAIKEPIDLLYMFWAITTGITVGASMYILAIAAYAIMVVVMYIMYKKSDSEEISILIIHLTSEADYDEIIRILGRTKFTVRSRVLRGSDMELTIEVSSNRTQSTLVEKINQLKSVSDVTALQYNGEYHG